MTRVRVAALVCLLASVALPSFEGAFADFSTETLVSAGDGEALDPACAVDFVDNVLVTFVEDGEVQFYVGPHFSGGGLALTDNGLTHSRPSVHASPAAAITFIYAEESAAGELDVFQLVNSLGTFQPEENLSDSADADFDPEISSATSTTRNVVWTREETTGDRTVQVSLDLAAAIELDAGEQPSVSTDSEGGVHVVYARSGDIYYRFYDGVGFGAEVTVSDDAASEGMPRVSADIDGEPHVVFERGGEVYYAVGEGTDSFSDPVLVSGTATDAAAPSVIAVGELVGVLVYEADGDLWLTSVVGGDFVTAAENITSTDGVESSAAFGVDSHGFVHVVYLRDGDIYYRNDAPAPEPAVEVSESIGEAPFTVAFTYVGEGGPVTSIAWDFGDGNEGNGELAEHTFEVEGTYDVTVTAVGPGGVVESVFEALIEVTPPRNFFRVPTVRAFSGQPNVVIPVLGSHLDDAQGYQVAGAFDTTQLSLDAILTETTVVDVLEPEFFVPSITASGTEGYFTVGLVIDTLPPFDGRTLAAGVEQRLLNLDFSVNFTAPSPSTAVVDLRNDIGSPVIVNIFTIDGASQVPALEDGAIEIIPFILPLPPLFLRGDANDDGLLSLIDALDTLQYIFNDGPEPACLDGADTNDDGLLSISDSVVLLTFLFVNGPVPPYPYPSPGLDPTDDDDFGCGG